LADDVLFEFRYHFPDYPETVRGRQILMDLYADYSMNLRSADGLVVHHDHDTGAVILEYEVHGTAPSGHAYDNRFVSIAYIKDRKIVRWRDYMDSLAAITAIRGS
jgi:ketosteroid isomerase-like protein